MQNSSEVLPENAPWTERVAGMWQRWDQAVFGTAADAPKTTQSFELQGASASPEAGSSSTVGVYLPKEVNGFIVLINEDGDKWQATNKYLQAKTSGLSYRRSKSMTDKVRPLCHLTWGMDRPGVDEGDGWVRMEADSTCTDAGNDVAPSHWNSAAGTSSRPCDDRTESLLPEGGWNTAAFK